MIIQSKLYIDLAKKTYSQEQFKKTIEQMMPMLMGNTCPDMPKKLIDMMIAGMQEEYQQALKIHSECLAQTYTEPQAAVLLAFYEENPWVLTKGAEFSMMSMQRMMTEYAPDLAERIIDEYEKIEDEEMEDDLRAEYDLSTLVRVEKENDE
jgi:hypothetical protein